MSPGDDDVAPVGERVDLDLRVVVSPATGRFDEGAAHVVGQAVHPGDVLGRVGEEPVLSPFAGTLVAMAALTGERLRPGGRVAWLAVPSADEIE